MFKSVGKVASVAGLALSLLDAVVPDLLPHGWALGGIVLLGLAYGGLVIDSENATDYLVVVLAASAAAVGNVLTHLPFVGTLMDAVLDNVVTGLLASAVTVLANRTTHRLRLMPRRKKQRTPTPQE